MTQPEMDAFAETVVLTIKAALAPVLERLSAAETRLSMLPTTEKALTDLRDRVVVVETKAAMPLPPVLEHVIAPAVDLSPVLERMSVAEARIGEIGQRVSAVELKPAPVSAPVDLAPVTTAVGELTKDFSAIRERIAVVEVRAQVPGPAGKDGANGRDGNNGTDGLGFDDLSANFDGNRTIELVFERGTQKKSFPITLPFMRQQGVYAEGKSYVLGDVVTWGGSQWHANEETNSKPGDGSKAWTLIVKRGRDGRDGVDAPTIPVVSVGR